MKQERRHYSVEEKVAFLRRHRLDKVFVSDLCEELGLRPTVFYGWQKEFFENGAAVNALLTVGFYHVRTPVSPFRRDRDWAEIHG